MILTHGANSLPTSGGGAVIGGRTYRTVVMPDGKEWLAENLDYKWDGLGITSTLTTSPSGCYYNDSETDYGIDGTYKCGLLYNWYAIKYLNDNKSTLCPGWRVATDYDWNDLATAIGNSPAPKLKAIDNSVSSNWPSGWNGTDDYELSITPCGYNNGTFRDLGRYYFTWTLTESGDAEARLRWFSKTDTSIGNNILSKKNLMSIRLVKDAT
jgi:uncharacterized protein (TIGR02145 family)